MNRHLSRRGLLAATLAIPPVAQAQVPWRPTQTIRIAAPARARRHDRRGRPPLGQHLQSAWGQSVVIDKEGLKLDANLG